MKRVIVLFGLISVFTLSVIFTAQQGGGQQASRIVEVEKLKDNLYVLRGGGGNTTVFIASRGVVVVDTMLPGWGQPILNKIKELTNQPVTTLINTHTHPDHVSGNVEFPAGVEIIVHENTKENMERMIPNSTIADHTVPKQTIFEANSGRGWPKRTFSDRLTLFRGLDEVTLYYFGRGHTNGDAWVVFPAVRTVYAGDIVSGKNVPLLDANNGGSAALIAETLQKAHDSLKNVDTIITGHSTQMTMADLKEYVQFNREFFTDVREAKKAGKSIDDIAMNWKISEKYKGYAVADVNRVRNNVRLAFREIDQSVK